MTDKENKNSEHAEGAERGFLASIFLGLVRDLVKFVIAFVVGTGGAAIACWYYGVPLGFSLIGGFVVLGLALALTSDSLLS
ncbi:MAG: hypothetical protein K0U72_16030 [Gammaproteobacteria bacterium]|nr:hypothetical protein [Gammaproteobacteria bacterium]